MGIHNTVDTASRNLNIEYALTQGFYWMGNCVASSFAAVYLKGLGYGNSEIGLVMAVGYIFGFLLPPVQSALIDRGRGITVMSVIPALLGLQGAVLLGLLGETGKSLGVSSAFAAYIAFSIAGNALNTKLSIDLTHCGGQIRYNVTRGVGSLCYVLSSWALGQITQRCGVRILPYAGLLMILCQAAVYTAMRRELYRCGVRPARDFRQEEASGTPLLRFMRENRRYMALLFGVMLIFIAHYTVNSFMINVVESVGGNTATMGLANSFIGVVELPVMFCYGRLSRRIRVSTLLRFGILFFPVKILCIALAGSVPALFAAILLHGLSYAVYTPAVVEYVAQIIPYKDSAKGQSLAFAVSTLGAVFACVAGGAMFDRFSVRTTLLLLAGVAALGSFISSRAIVRQPRSAGR